MEPFLVFMLWPLCAIVLIMSLAFLLGRESNSDLKQIMKDCSSKSERYKKAKFDLYLNKAVNPFAIFNTLFIIVAFLTVDVEIMDRQYDSNVHKSEQVFYSNQGSSVNTSRSFSYGMHVNNYDNEVYYTLRFKNDDGSFYDKAIVADSLKQDSSLVDYGIVKKFEKCYGLANTIDLSFYNKGVQKFFHGDKKTLERCYIDKVEIYVPEGSLSLGISLL